VGGGGRALRPGGLKAVGRGTLSSGAAIAVLSILFFTWGGLTSLNDVLIPHLKAVFEMNYARTMLIQFTFFSTYLVMSIPAGRVVAHLGYKPSMVAGLMVAGRRARLLSGGDRAVVSAVPAGPLRARERHHAAAGLGQPVYQPHR